MRNSSVIKYHFTRMRKGGGGLGDVIIDSPFGINSGTIKFVDDNSDDVRLNISEVSSLLLEH